MCMVKSMKSVHAFPLITISMHPFILQHWCSLLQRMLLHVSSSNLHHCLYYASFNEYHAPTIPHQPISTPPLPRPLPPQASTGDFTHNVVSPANQPGSSMCRSADSLWSGQRNQEEGRFRICWLPMTHNLLVVRGFPGDKAS